MPSLSVIIVSWNVKNYLEKCLVSLEQNRGDLSLEIFVVDNASSDGSAAMVREKFPQVKLTANEKNLGFARANNQAIRQATGDYILLLNPDTEILPGSLKKCLDFMARTPEAAILGCQLLNVDHSVQPSVRRFPSLAAIFLMFWKLPKIFPRLPSVSHYLAVDFDYQKTQPVDQVMGAFMLVRKQVFTAVGLLDEKFFIWFEEVDFCRRAFKKGLKTYYFAGAKIIHHGGQSFAQQGIAGKQWRFFRSAARYFLKNLIYK